MKTVQTDSSENQNQGFVRNASCKSRNVRFSFVHAFSCALSGFWHAIKTQRNMRIHLVFTIVALIACLLLGVSPIGIALVLLCIGLVLAFECMNTALEAVVDLVSPDYHDLARRAKDCAAAAVLVCAVISVAVGLLVFANTLLIL